MTRKVVHFLDSAEFGGTEQAVLHILAGLDRRHWQPVLFHHPEPGITPLLKGAEALNVKLRQVPRMKGKRSLVTCLPRFVRALRAEQPAVFHAHLNGPLACKDGLIAAALARVPGVVATAQLFVNLPLSPFRYAQQRFVATRVDRYIAVSHEVAARLGQTFRIPARKINVVYNGVPVSSFNRSANAALRAALTGSTGRPIVLTAARLAEQKGLCYLLKAAALVPEAIFVLAGEGPERANLEAQAGELGLNKRVLFLGYRQDVPDLLACCDLFVLPSLFEGLPLSILEAMAANKPVVASAVGGNDEAIVHGETGLLVPPANPTALAAAIQTVLSNSDLGRRLGAAGKARVHEHFSAEAMVRQVAHIYEEVLSAMKKSFPPTISHMAATNPLREEVRNRLLRRADWRFLLASPQPTKSICFANGLLGRAVRLISDRMADERLDTIGDCDLAVVVNPTRATLRKGWRALRPGGSCYTEWYSPLAGGPKGIRRRLEAAGFEDVACYWAWPWPCLSHPRYWLPLGAPGALHHFLLSRPPALGIVRRIVNAGLRALWLSSLRLGLTLPICAVAHKAALTANHHPSTVSQVPSSDGRLSASGISQDLSNMIRDKWRTWGLGPTPDHVSSLVLTGGHRSVGKVVWLVFAEPDYRPRLAVKMPRVPESVPGLTREATTLQSIQALRPSGVQGVPRVLFCQEHAGLLIVGETALTGQPMNKLLTQKNYRDFALKATAWLADLGGRPASCPPGTWWNRLVEPVLTDFEELFGSVVDTGMLRETKDILATLGSLPLVCEQRDFGPWNVLVTTDERLAVLDWESSEPLGLPALDLIYFLSYLIFFLDGTLRPNSATKPGRFRESYRAALDPTTVLGSLRSECLARYASLVGLDSDALRPLGVLVWLIHSRSEFQHFSADVAGIPEREALRRSLFVSLWEEEVRHFSLRQGSRR